LAALFKTGERNAAICYLRKETSPFPEERTATRIAGTKELLYEK